MTGKPVSRDQVTGALGLPGCTWRKRDGRFDRLTAEGAGSSVHFLDRSRVMAILLLVLTVAGILATTLRAFGPFIWRGSGQVTKWGKH